MTWPENYTPEQKEAVEELKRRTINDLTPKLLEDKTLFYRFCKARDFNVNNAEDMLRKHIQWRKDFKTDTLMQDFKPLEVMDKYSGTCVVGFDKEGCLIRYFDFGNVDVKGLLNSVKTEDALRHFVLEIERDVAVLEQQTKKLGKPVTQYCHICNFQNMTFSKATYKKGLQLAMQFLKIFQDQYPERLRYSVHINASYYHTLIYNFVKIIVAAPVLNKTILYGCDGWKEELLKHIDADVLPAFLGGNRTDPDGNPLCRTIINHASEIPKSYYLSNSKKNLSNAKGVEKMTITRFSKEELNFDIQEPGSYLEWEFETKNRDIGFAVYYKESSSKEEKPVELVPKQRIDTCYETEKGVFKCEKPGTYTMVFDNSYSWIHQKEIYYRTNIRSPCDTEIQEWA